MSADNFLGDPDLRQALKNYEYPGFVAPKQEPSSQPSVALLESEPRS